MEKCQRRTLSHPNSRTSDVTSHRTTGKVTTPWAQRVAEAARRALPATDPLAHDPAVPPRRTPPRCLCCVYWRKPSSRTRGVTSKRRRRRPRRGPHGGEGDDDKTNPTAATTLTPPSTTSATQRRRRTKRVLSLDVEELERDAQICLCRSRCGLHVARTIELVRCCYWRRQRGCRVVGGAEGSQGGRSPSDRRVVREQRRRHLSGIGHALLKAAILTTPKADERRRDPRHFRGKT